MNDKKPNPFASIVQSHLEAPKTTEKTKRKTRTTKAEGELPVAVAESKPIEKKKDYKTGVDLDELTELRTLYWFRKLLEKTGCKPSEIEKKYVINIETPEFGLYAIGRRKPQKSSLVAIDLAMEVGTGKRPLKDSSILYTRGPDGARLWDVLADDVEACRAIVDDFYEEEFGETALINSNFDEKIAYIFTMFNLDPADLEFLRQRSKEHQLKAFQQNALLTTSMKSENLGHPLYLSYKSGVRYPFDLLVVAMALRVLAYQNKTNMAEVDFMMMGVLRVLVEQMPEVKEELYYCISTHVTRITSPVFNTKGLKGVELINSLFERGLF